MAKTSKKETLSQGGMAPESATQDTQLTAPQAAGLATVGAPQRGFEGGIDQEDLIIPRAKLIQAMSPEMAEGIAGVRVGSIINSLTKEVLPAEFIPVFPFKNYIRFNPRNKEDAAFDSNFEPGAIIWRSNDALDPRVVAETKFGTNGEKPIATTFLNFFCFFPGLAMPIIVSFSKTNYRAGKELLSVAKFTGKDMFSRKYTLTSKMESNASGTYAVFKVTPGAFASPEEYKIGEQLWKEYAMKTSDIKVHEESGDDAAAQTESTGKPW